MTRGEGMSIPWRSLIFTSVMAALTRMHGVVEVIPYGLLKGIPFGKVVIPVTGMARNTVQAFGLMDICLRAPLTSSLLSIGESMTEPAISVRRSPDDLKMDVIKFRNLFFRIVYIHLIHFRISRLILRKFYFGPSHSYSGSIFEEPSS
jgi:hypothetical protein